MRLRPPSVPIITVDPYFSIWSPNEKINVKPTVHWTGTTQSIVAGLVIDGKRYNFLGYDRDTFKLTQTAMDCDALSTEATFEGAGIRAKVSFTSPLLINELDIMTRPVSYMNVSYESTDGKAHTVELKVNVDDTVCLDKKKQKETAAEEVKLGKLTGMKVGAVEQLPLNRSGDNLRIDWGYFYLLTSGSVSTSETLKYGVRNIKVASPMVEGEDKLVLFAYDDLGASINYFGKTLPSYWNKEGKKIEEAITEAFADYADVKQRCDDFSDKLIADAYMAGGEKYADICALAYRQALAAHKVAVDDNGDILFISKECFSNGCAATVDVSYPSIPLFLIYNPELLKGMLRPIYKFAASDGWKYDFAPHDVGQYPLVTGQVYGLENGELLYDMQMPVEECGNMIIMETNVALATGDAAFAKEHFDVLRAWAAYLEKYGNDPENQLCTDDFAGHLAHNCNLSLKAIMGIEGMSILCGMIGDEEGKASYHAKAVEMANSWVERAKKPDGSYKLTFTDADEATFSQKYNMVWDKIWGTGIFPDDVTETEIESNLTHFNEYGMPLDSRAEYTKADWLVWTATMAKSKADFKRFIAPLWKYYNDTPDRDPMTDWYDTVSCTRVGFIHRTVIAGLFIKTLDESGKVKLPR